MIGSGDMTKFFSKSAKGFSHEKDGKRCQDFSACYHDEERTIVVCCDGHGGEPYVRSHLGSKFATRAVINAFLQLDKKSFYKCTRSEIEEKLKLAVLCEWNSMVEKDLEQKHICKKEVAHLNEKQIFGIIKNPAKLYGTTHNAAMFFGTKVIFMSLGDGGVFALSKGEVIPVFQDDDEPVANVTYSLCQEDAYKHLNVAIFDSSSIDGVVTCTDGLINPYQNMQNFKKSFVCPAIWALKQNDSDLLDDFVDKLATQIGYGDDVSLAMAIKKQSSLRRYKGKDK